MLKIRVEANQMGLKQPRTFVTCPQCEFEDFFHNFINRSCDDCGFEWGNIHALMEDIRVRGYYFEHGEID
jgi:uncharacterized protein (DUF983 family)